MTLPGYFWDRWPYFAGKLSRDTTTATTQVNSAWHPSRVTKWSTTFGWGKGGKVTTAEQVTMCDPTWHVITHRCVEISITNCYIPFTLLLLFTFPASSSLAHHFTCYNIMKKVLMSELCFRYQIIFNETYKQFLVSHLLQSTDFWQCPHFRYVTYKNLPSTTTVLWRNGTYQR